MGGPRGGRGGRVAEGERWSIGEVGGWPKVMVVKSYCASYDALHHPIRDQQERSRKQRGERG